LGDVLAGDIWTMPLPAILSIIERVTDEDAAPMIASTFWLSSRSTD